jgi:hypothetical protein
LEIKYYQWDDWNIDHIARHGVEPEEAEEVFRHRPFIRRSRKGRYLAYGQTDVGRYLAVAFEYLGKHTARVVMARDATRTERRELRKRRL